VLQKYKQSGAGQLTSRGRSLSPLTEFKITKIGHSGTMSWAAGAAPNIPSTEEAEINGCKVHEGSAKATCSVNSIAAL